MDRANRDGAERVEGAANPDCLDLNCTSLRLKVAASMAHMKVKWSDAGKGTEIWRMILVITKGKMIFITGCRIPMDSYNRKNEMRRKIYSKMLKKGQQKLSTRLCDRVVVRKRVKNKCHDHVQKPRAFSKGRTISELMLTQLEGCS